MIYSDRLLSTYINNKGWLFENKFKKNDWLVFNWKRVIFWTHQVHLTNVVLNFSESNWQFYFGLNLFTNGTHFDWIFKEPFVVWNLPSTVTVKEQLAVFELESVASTNTIWEPITNWVPETGVTLAVSRSPELSVTLGARHITTAKSSPRMVSITMSAGHSISGGSTSEKRWHFWSKPQALCKEWVRLSGCLSTQVDQVQIPQESQFK